MAIKELCRLPIDEYRERQRDLLNVYSIRGTDREVKVADNLTNRLALGVDLPQHNAVDLDGMYLNVAGLKPFQIEDVKRMVQSNAFLNRNRMGSGKTVETVVACRERKFRNILVVCPKPTIGQWVAQFKAWWPVRANDICAFEFNDKLEDGHIYITNYEKLVNAKSKNRILGTFWDCVVLDEIHYIRKRDSKRTQAALELNAGCKYGLSGTVIQKNPSDLWSILQFLDPAYGAAGYWAFTNYYCEVVEGYFGKEIKGLTNNPDRVLRLNKLLAHIGCYHDIQVAKGKQRIVVPLLMESKQRVLYNKIKKLLLDELPPGITIANGAVKVMRLLQATSSPQLLGETVAGVKFEWILNFLESTTDEKIIVYSNYTKPLSLLRTYLTKAGITCATYTGECTEREQQQAKIKFMNDPNCRVLTGTIGALGTGIDGLQYASHICVFLDQSYLPEINEQCEGRLERDGQTQEVLCYYLQCEKTWDTKVESVNLTRSDDIRRALKGE